MKTLCIKHDDFKLYIECQHFSRIWQKGNKNIGAERLTSTYKWTEGVSSAVLIDDEDNNTTQELTHGNPQEKAFFFELTDYAVWVEFKDYVTNAAIDTPRNDVNECFSWRKQQHILMGFLNYGNDIGRADLPLRYMKNGEWHRFVFSYDVISSKLDYHHDWRLILEDIEREYRMLSLDYLRRTYHGISTGEGEQYDLVWWNIFGSLQEKFITAARNIIERPRHRLRAVPTYKRADQIRRFTPTLEQQFAEHRTEEVRLYLVDEQQHTHNTIENRFLKYALATISKRYTELAKRISQLNIHLAPTERERIETTEEQLKTLLRHPFFRTVGTFEGLRQESLILQRDTNYSAVYRTYLILRQSFSLNDGLYRMETKDIATLYEIWCFIEVSHIVRNLLGEDTDMEHRNRMEMSNLFTLKLGKGEHSHIVFKKDDVELAELVYNPKHTDKENDSLSISNIEVRTVPQKPDIVLRLTKNDVEQGMKMTYLFDAKYRIGERDTHHADTPPDDAINQMHRYRDAIYYKEYGSDALKKEVVGGYILFPGNGELQDVQMSRFYKSIGEVNIGAFPLRPHNTGNRQLLSDFIQKLIDKKSKETIEQVLPPKGGAIAVDSSSVLIAPTSSKEKFDWCLSNGVYPIPLSKAHTVSYLLSADYAILHFADDIAMKHISRGKIELKSRADLEQMGYPSPSHESYLLLTLTNKGKYIDTRVTLSRLDAKRKQGVFVVEMDKVIEE